MTSDLDQTISYARQELRDYLHENPDEREPHERIGEIADGAVPIYYSDILSCAAQDTGLALSEPEIGPAFDGAPTPINIIAANIYERIEKELWEEWKEFEDERDDADDCVECGEPVFEWQESTTCADCSGPQHIKCVAEGKDVCSSCQEKRDEENAELDILEEGNDGEADADPKAD